MRKTQIILATLFVALITMTGCKKEDENPPVTYTVTFDSQGADTEADPASMTVTGPATTLGELPTEPEKSGYAFGGWYTEVDGGGTRFTDMTMVTEDITVYANWIQVIFSITYDTNGGTLGSAPADNASYSSNDVVTVLGNTGNLAGPEIRDGIRQRFIGWNSDPGATTASYLQGYNIFLYEDITLYAIYTSGDEVLQKIGPAGGWVFYDAGSTESWGRYLEAANPGWIDGGDEPESQWLGHINGGFELTGTSDEIGAGEENTNIICSFVDGLYLKSDGTTTYYDYDWAGLAPGSAVTFTDGVTDYNISEMNYGDGTVAARVCSDYSVVYNNLTFDDWFLPSKNELNQIYINLKKEGVEGFAPTNAYYWSSSEADGYNAWNQFFGFMGPDDGPQEVIGKASVRWFRAVRAF